MVGAVLISNPVPPSKFEAITHWRNGYFCVVWHYKCIGQEVAEVIAPTLDTLPSRLGWTWGRLLADQIP